MMKHMGLMILTAVLVLVAGPQDVAAQCGDEFSLGCSGAGSHHTFYDNPDGMSGGTEHTDCQYCPQSHPCHGTSCTPDEEDEDVQLAYSQAVEAANRGDLFTLLNAGADAGGYVLLNQSRMAVQVLSCTGEGVVASVRLDPQMFAAAETLFEQRQD